MPSVQLVVRDTCREPGYVPAKREFAFSGRTMTINPNVPFSIEEDVFVQDLHRVKCGTCGYEDTLRQASRKFSEADDGVAICLRCGGIGEVRLQLPEQVMLVEDFDAWWEERRLKTLQAAAAEGVDA